MPQSVTTPHNTLQKYGFYNSKIHLFTFKSQEFYVYPVINEEKTGIITLPNVLIKLMIYDLQNVTKEMRSDTNSRTLQP